jgi:hypothetical protein
VQAWAQRAVTHNAGLAPGDDHPAPLYVPFGDLLRPNIEGGLPERMPFSGSFDPKLYFLRLVLQALWGKLLDCKGQSPVRLLSSCTSSLVFHKHLCILIVRFACHSDNIVGPGVDPSNDMPPVSVSESNAGMLHRACLIIATSCVLSLCEF